MGFLAVAILFAGCAKETEPEKTGTKMVLKAGIADLKSTASASGGFAWSEGDVIYAFDIWNNPQPFSLTSGAGTKNAEFTSDAEVDGLSGYAFFVDESPYSWGGRYQVSLTNYYGDSDLGKTHSPMIAAIPEGTNPSLAFKHLCGLVKVTVKGLNGTLTRVSLQSHDNPISGSFDIQDVGQATARIETEPESGSTQIDYNLYKEVSSDIDIYFPVPVGTYSGFTISVEGRDDSYNDIQDNLTIDRSVTIARGELRTVEMKVVARYELDRLAWMTNGEPFHSKVVVVRAVADNPSLGYVVGGPYGSPTYFVSGNAGTLFPGHNVLVGGIRAQTESGYVYVAEGTYELVYTDKDATYFPYDITTSIDYYSADAAEFVQVTGVVSTVGGKKVITPEGATTGVEVYALGKGVTMSASDGETKMVQGYLIDKKAANFQMLVTRIN